MHNVCTCPSAPSSIQNRMENCSFFTPGYIYLKPHVRCMFVLMIQQDVGANLRPGVCYCAHYGIGSALMCHPCLESCHLSH